MTRRGAEALIALALTAAILVVGGAVLLFFSTISPVHTDPAAVPSTAAAPPSARDSDAVDDARRLARALLVEDNLPGLSVAVAVDGELVWAEGFGFADLRRRAPVTPLTKFRLGSVSKTLTAAAVALLHDPGRIDFDTPVQTYVPSYPRKPWPITTRQLLGDIAACRAPSSTVNGIPDTTSFYFPRAFEQPRWGVEEAGPRPSACLFGAGAYLSTPSDMARFGSAMLKPALLKADTIELLQTPLRLASGTSTDFALGWKVEHVQLNGGATRMVAHRATPIGGTTALLIFPERRLVIAAMSNVSRAEGVAPFGVKVAEVFAQLR